MSTLRVSLQAELDLEENWLYIARDNRKAATKLRKDIEDRFGMLSRQP
jgi:plasmid stabilization system protein ParE